MKTQYAKLGDISLTDILAWQSRSPGNKIDQVLGEEKTYGKKTESSNPQERHIGAQSAITVSKPAIIIFKEGATYRVDGRKKIV